MNTYNENLQQTVVNTLSAMSLQQSSLDSVQTIAEFNLYQAQDADITARDKLAKTQFDISIWQGITEQSLLNENQVFNLLASATEANTDVTSSITNTATAASNVQIASNAISVLASDIGAALNIATASLYDTDVYKRIVNANSFINEVANESKRIAKDAMNTSSYTSEITTTEVLAQTQSLKSQIDNIFKSSQTELDNFFNQAIAENTQISQASQAERQAEGALKDANREVTAINSAYVSANSQLNYGLNVTVVSGAEIEVYFESLPSPFPTFNSTNASAIAIPDATPNYYLALLPAQNQATFSLDQAQQLFAQRAPGDDTSFIPVEPQLNYPVTLVNDVNGNPIAVGSSYVAYLYIELSQAYKQFVSNFSDLLSAPSQSFVPATTLPSPAGLNYSYSAPIDGQSWASILFDVVSLYTQDPLAAAKAAAAAAAATTAEEEAAIAAAAYTDANIAAIAANKSVAAAGAIAAVADSDAAQTATAATQAAAAATAAATAADQATAAAIAAAEAAEQANAEYKADPTPENKAAAAAANKKAAAANTAETKAIAASADAAAKSVAAAKASTDAATAKTAADAAKTAADTAAAEAAAAVSTTKAIADAAADKAKTAKATADAAAAVQGTPAMNQLFADASLEYRCILVESNQDPYLSFLLCGDEGKGTPIYFNLAIAEQVSPANYTTATLGQLPQLLYEVEFLPGTTDNFGNLIKPDTEYTPYILAVADGDTADQFVNVLTGSFAPLVVCTQQTQQ